MPALRGRAGGAGADQARHDLRLALVRSQEVDCLVVAALGTLDVDAGHGGVENVIQVGHVLLGACVVREVPTWSSLL